MTPSWSPSMSWKNCISNLKVVPGLSSLGTIFGTPKVLVLVLHHPFHSASLIDTWLQNERPSWEYLRGQTVKEELHHGVSGSRETRKMIQCCVFVCCCFKFYVFKMSIGSGVHRPPNLKNHTWRFFLSQSVMIGVSFQYACWHTFLLWPAVYY